MLSKWITLVIFIKKISVSDNIGSDYGWNSTWSIESRYEWNKTAEAIQNSQHIYLNLGYGRNYLHLKKLTKYIYHYYLIKMLFK